MAVVIRLLGLPFIAGPVDIRHFFKGLTIPDGGVHIIGGKVGEAFIIFATDEDARRAISRSGGFIKDSSVELFLSSKVEMQKTIEMKRTARVGRGRPGSGASGVGNVYHFSDALKEEESYSGYGSSVNRDAGFHTNGTGLDLRPRKTRPLKAENPYLFLRGLPYLVNEDDVRVFFSGLCVDGVILLKHHDGRNNGDAIVKFASCVDASGGLKCHRSFMGSRFIEVMLGLHKTVLQYRPVLIDPVSRKEMVRIIECYEKKRPESLEKERPGRVSQKYSQEGFSGSGQKLCIYIRNLPFDVTKGEVQKFFADFSLVEDDIYLLCDDKGVGLGEALVRFKSEEQAMKAERLNRQRFLGIEVLLRLISEEQMQEFGIKSSWLSNERTQACSRSHDGDDCSCLFDLKDPSSCSFGQSESLRYHPKDLRKMGHFKHPQGYFRQSDRCSPEDFRHSPEDYRHPWEEHTSHSREEDWRLPLEDWPQEDDFRQCHEKDHRQLRSPWEEDFRRPSQEHFRRSYQEHIRRPPQEHFRRSREEDFRHVADEDFRQASDEDFRISQEDLRYPTDEDFRRVSVEDLREVPEKDLRLPKNFRSSGEEFWTPPDFRGQHPFVNFDHLQGGKFDFEKYKLENFHDGKFVPDLKFNCGSGGIIRVMISNLPFKANANEILDFFHGYEVIPDSVSIQYNEEGLPLGEAIVSMTNYNEALSAVKDLSGRPVGPRKVKLSLL